MSEERGSVMGRMAEKLGLGPTPQVCNAEGCLGKVEGKLVPVVHPHRSGNFEELGFCEGHCRALFSGAHVAVNGGNLRRLA